MLMETTAWCVVAPLAVTVICEVPSSEDGTLLPPHPPIASNSNRRTRRDFLRLCCAPPTSTRPSSPSVLQKAKTGVAWLSLPGPFGAMTPALALVDTVSVVVVTTPATLNAAGENEQVAKGDPPLHE